MTQTQTTLNSSTSNIALAARNSAQLYDSTGINAVDRLASGIESLIIPQSEYWHGMGVLDLSRDEFSDEEHRWFEKVRNLMFRVRYDADSGWITASQTAMRRCVAFGNAFMFVGESFDNKSIINYRYLPLNECHVAEDHNGKITQFYREYSLTASQAMSDFGNKCPETVKRAAESQAEKDQRFIFIHAILPRADFELGGMVDKAPFQSVHVERDSKTVVRESGFFEFPVIDFRWLPEPGRTYGEGPVMRCLADIQSLNKMAKNEQIAGDQAVRPTLLVANAGVMNRPTARPGEMIYGGMSANGQRLVEPLFNGQRLDFATMVLEAKRNQVKDSMYLNLFQLLVKNPQMTAHEAMIRAGEKADLLGPAGSRLQQSLSRLIDREVGILARRGAFRPGTSLEIPRRLQGKKSHVQFTSPLDRMRRAKEGEGILRLLETASPLAQTDPSVLDAIDSDETLRQLRDILGAPIAIMRKPEEIAKIRAGRQQAQAAQQNAQIAAEMAKAGAQGSQALVNMKSAGTL